MNKKKIFNDPVYGFITAPSEFVFDIIQHPYFQRLRRIKQLGLTDFVYPGALHTRFHHALGAMHLMNTALQTLGSKSSQISDKECEASLIAILLHDIGHGPFSHALETALLQDVHHEEISLQIMQILNREFGGKLDLAIQIFTNTYPRTFFHQLVSSQLDVDRLDYLNRDSFYTGVYEGKIGASRIIKMLDVVNDRLVVEEKGIYSIENFLVSRRLMYWQVYLHKTAVGAEQMLLRTLQRARQLARAGENVPASPPLHFFLTQEVTLEEFRQNDTAFHHFIALDDIDIWSGIKEWASHPDRVLSFLSRSLLDRRLFRVVISATPFPEQKLAELARQVQEEYHLSEVEASFLLIAGTISNNAYDAEGETIDILTKSGKVVDVAKASDLPSIKALGKNVEKSYVCFPKSVAFDFGFADG
ncbi:HD domain-containing protein [soil metagenome]